MKRNSFVLTIWILYILATTGCASVDPLVTDYDDHFNNIESSQQDLVKASPIKKTFHNAYDEVWDSTLYILAQHAIIIESSKESGGITYLSIAGIFPEDPSYYWEFPFTVLITKEDPGTTIYVYPMTNLYDDKYKESKWRKVLGAEYDHKGKDLIDKLSTQLTAQERWEWLRN